MMPKPMPRVSFSSSRCWPLRLSSVAVAGVAGALVSFAAIGAATADAVRQERAQIAVERDAAEMRYATRQRECGERFIVTSCVDDAKRERRESLGRLSARQRLVDDADRHERALARRNEISEKAAEDARRDRERDRVGHGPASAVAGSGLGRDRARPSGPVDAGKAPARELPQRRAERENASRAAYAKRQADASLHRQQSASRALRRDAAKAPAASLPVPGATAGSAPVR